MEIRKAHQAIFIRPDQNLVPLIARKLFNLLVRHAQESGLQHVKYSIPFRTIAEQLAYQSNDYDLLKGHLRQLQKVQVEWDAITEKGKRPWGVSGLVMYAEIADGVCIDLGLKDFAATDDGAVIEAQKYYRKMEDKLAIAQCAGKKDRSSPSMPRFARAGTTFIIN